MCDSPTETGLYYLQSRYYDPEICRFINPDGYASTGQGLLGGNAFVYCGNCPVSRTDATGTLWNTIIGTIAGALVGGITAAVTGTDIKAGMISGAISGAVTGAAVDIAIMTGGVGVAAFVVVTMFGGIGGAASSYTNQRMNGTSHKDVDWNCVIVDGIWGAVGAALTFGVADVGGPAMKTTREILKQSTHKIVKQATTDFATSVVISAGTWLNGTKAKLIIQMLK